MPVFLWELGLGLAGLCLLVGVSGAAFALALGPWQRLSRSRALAALLGWTFALELVLVLLVALSASALDGSAVAHGLGPVPLVVALAVGAANGAYNAFYWSTQRALFASLGSERDSGRRYGNLQIVVAVFVKLGILLGGLLLDADGIGWILLLSCVVGTAATWRLAADADARPLQDEPYVSLRESLAYRDRSGSAPVFAIDGLFLYLESHFWTLSLFLLVREDHSRLGAVVVLLGIGFALLFLLVKNRIDHPAVVGPVYRACVGLYALSWLLRVLVDETTGAAVTFVLLLAVTFCSSLFRLAFNKRFFDVAATTPRGTIGYLVAKSHVSQLVLAAVFVPLALALALFSTPPTARVLDALYLGAAALSLGYLLYRRPGVADDPIGGRHPRTRGVAGPPPDGSANRRGPSARVSS